MEVTEPVCKLINTETPSIFLFKSNFTFGFHASFHTVAQLATRVNMGTWREIIKTKANARIKY